MRKLIILLMLLILMVLTKPILAQSVPDSLLQKQLEIESQGKHMITEDSIITSPAGAMGVAQFMPSTWKWLKDYGYIPEYFDIMNESHQLKARKIFIEYLYSVDYGIRDEDSMTQLAFASYNAGVNRVKNLVAVYHQSWRDHLPKETKNYLKLLNL